MDTFLVKCSDCVSPRVPNSPLLLRETCAECAAMTAQRHLGAFPTHHVQVFPPPPSVDGKKRRMRTGRRR